jgi:hypothetical protein
MKQIDVWDRLGPFPVEPRKVKGLEIQALKDQKFTKESYFGGKAAAYGDIWELLVFGPGRAPSPEEYNRMNELHSKEVVE